MEHLTLPRDVAAPGPSLVPYVCKEEYDGGPFMTYTERLGGLKSLAAEAQLDYDYFGRVSRIPLVELESFVQTWIFFGLLTEVLGNLFVPSQYVATASSANPAKVLNTSQLVPTIETWMQQVQQSADTEEEKKNRYNHIAACLRHTSTVLNAVRSSMRSDFNPLIRSSIASVGELLTQATNRVYVVEDFFKDNHCPGVWQLLYDDSFYAKQLLSSGYCPHEVHRIRNLSLTVQSYHLLVWMDRGGPNTQHQSCTDKECRANQIVKGRYTTKHRCDGGRCPDFLIDVKEVIRILSRGSLPLLRITPGPSPGKVGIDIVEATPTTSYVAMSHVWADGLGNPDSNSLPRCQLQFLYETTTSLVERQPHASTNQDICIWIDTLCCPIEPPEAKTMALNQIKTPYTRATHVLVLDSSLQRVNALDLAPEEVCMRIFTSGWMRRLWTLQEGALPRSLWFQFRDSAVDLDLVFTKAFDKIYNKDISRSALMLDILVLYRGLRHFFHAEEGMPIIDLASVDDALHFRSLSVSTDEALLIGGLLNVDLAYILAGPEESRMQRLWSLIPSTPGGIPKNILFNRGSRLRQTGHRWAPASLLTYRGGKDGIIRSREAHSEGQLTSTGLKVQLPAFSTATMASAPRGAPKNPWGLFNNQDENSIRCRNERGIWFYMAGKYSGSGNGDQGTKASLHTILKDTSRAWSLLLASAFKFDGSRENSSGLLVHDTADVQPMVPSKVSSEMIVEVAKQDHLYQVMFEAVYQASQSLLSDEITAQYAELAIEDEEEQKQNSVYANLGSVLEKKVYTLAESIYKEYPSNAASAQNSHIPKNMVPALIAAAYLGNYCILGPTLPSETEWCVD
ncbi:MAG: hypothetical protein Q9218_006274 [Villophora microphyllina]